MPTKMITSALTAHGDTVKTLIDTITVPGGVSKLVGVSWYAVGGAGVTTMENVTGILTLESDDINIMPLILPHDPVTVLTSGSVAMQPRIWPVDVPVTPGARIRGFATMDMAITVSNTCRFTLIFA